MNALAVEQRGAVRLPLPSAIPATLADANARIVEISLIGVRVEHSARMVMGSTVPLEFIYRSQQIRLLSKVARCEFQTIKGGAGYVSGLQFCASIFESPVPVRQIVASLVEEVMAPSLWSRARTDSVPFMRSDDEARPSTAPYLECALQDDRWQRRRLWAAQQPPQGFTMTAPSSDELADPFCSAYQTATPAARKLIRASAELSIVMTRKA